MPDIAPTNTWWQDRVQEFAEEGDAQAACCAHAEGHVMSLHPDIERGSNPFYERVYRRARETFQHR
jgi:hypothetical protein